MLGRQESNHCEGCSSTLAKYNYTNNNNKIVAEGDEDEDEDHKDSKDKDADDENKKKKRGKKSAKDQTTQEVLMAKYTIIFNNIESMRT